MRSLRRALPSIALLFFAACTGTAPTTLNASNAVEPAYTALTVPPPTTPPVARVTVVRASRGQSAPRMAVVRRGCLDGVRFCWTDDPFDALSACEAGMNPQRVSASGKYMGAFQWDLSSWRGLGESGKPTDYDYAYQKQVAKRMQGGRGWGPWPSCARKLNLYVVAPNGT